MSGHNAPKLSEQKIEEKLSNPVNSAPLYELAKGKEKCCIIFDDMTRPTRQSQMLPVVLKMLNKGGLKDDQIVFVMATGAHHGRLLSAESGRWYEPQRSGRGRHEVPDHPAHVHHRRHPHCAAGGA